MLTPEPITPQPTKHWITAVSFLTLLALFLGLTLTMVAPYFLSVMMGAILALLCFPFYKKLRAKQWSQKSAAMLVTIAVSIIIIGPVVAFGIVAVNEAISLTHSISAEENLTPKSISDELSQWKIIDALGGNPQDLERQIKQVIQSTAKSASTTTLAMIGSLPDRALQLALGLLSCFFLLIDGRRFLEWFQDKIPLDWDVRTRLYSSFKDTAISVLWATLAAASVQGLIMFLSFLIIRVPLAFLAGGATFIFAWIPVVGSTPVWVGAAIYLYTQGRLTAMILMLFMGIFTSLIDNYIRPLILKGRADLHPLVSLIAIFGGIGMFGIFGVLIGPILAAVLLSLLQIWPTVGRRFGLTFESKIEPMDSSLKN